MPSHPPLSFNFEIRTFSPPDVFKHGWFASPIFFGKYPDIMVEQIGRKSEAEGLPYSRLPTFEPLPLQLDRKPEARFACDRRLGRPLYGLISSGS